MSDVLGPVLARQLQEKLYDKRKQAALEVERLVRDAVLANNFGRVSQIVTSIARDFASSPVSNARNGGLIALAAVAIALGSQALKPRLAQVVPPILACFADPDTRVRYYACESMYNVGKVARRDLLVFFNEIFDAVSRLVADLDISVKNGAELLDRLIKDIVCEHAAFVSQHQHQQLQIQSTATTSSSAGHARFPSEPAFPATPGSIPLIDPSDAAIFNFPRFIPLLAERIKALNPFTRMFLIQWITTLDAIPFLEMVSYLPEFLDGLFGYLCDVNADVRTAALNLLGEFLKEIHDILTVHGYTPGVSGALKHSVSRKRSNSASADSHSQSLSNQQQQQQIQLQPHQPETLAAPTTSPLHKSTSSPDFDEEPLVRRPVSSLSLASTFFAEGGKIVRPQHNQQNHATTATTTITTMTSTSNLQHHIHPTPPPTLDFPKLISILLPYLSAHDEETQATALRWIHEFVTHLQPRVIMVPFTPDFIAAILPCLSHRALITPIRNLAIEVNTGLYRLVSDCAVISPPGGTDSFDVRAAVDALTAQFQDENEEARVASLDWLLMLHKKSPKKVVVVANTTSEDSVLVQSLLKLLSDPSEEVVKKDLQLLAQISISSDDAYFTRFLVLLLDLFRRDRRVLESRGSLILRHLCLCLNPERMFRAFAEILEREEELEFASTMVQNLNIILVTAPELADVRRRLKNLETRDGLLLFAVLYRCWCHNPISTFTLCLLSQAYEHAYHLITTHFTDLEITIQFLIQVDKLVQLIESPVFTYLRLQLLEPERFPWLYKCLYGVLMLLPQSSAFATLRNRLGCVQSLVALYGVGGSPFSGGSGGNGGGSVPGPSVGASPAPRTRTTKPQGSGTSSGSSGVNGGGGGTNDSIGLKWNELLLHFRAVQNRHERSRRVGARASSAGSTRRVARGATTTATATGSSSPSLVNSNRVSRTASGMEEVVGEAMDEASPLLASGVMGHSAVNARMQLLNESPNLSVLSLETSTGGEGVGLDQSGVYDGGSMGRTGNLAGRIMVENRSSATALSSSFTSSTGGLANLPGSPNPAASGSAATASGSNAGNAKAVGKKTTSWVLGGARK